MRTPTFDRLKRGFDVLVATVGLLVTFPVQALVAIVVLVRLGTPVLFRQQRPGKDEQLFTLVKFRTMLEPDPGRGLETDADRMTGLGRFLRATSLDELPTLWNVLRGSMSLVGPRPLLPHYLPLYSPRQALRHSVRPGITGLAQVHGRNGLGWDERLELDVQYVEARSFTLDARILLGTIATVARRHGISGPGHPTMTEFTGNDPPTTGGGP